MVISPAAGFVLPRSSRYIRQIMGRYEVIEYCNVRFWHKADIPRLSSDIRFWG